MNDINYNEVDFLKLWYWNKYRIRILTKPYNFSFQEYHNIFRRNIKWFYRCTKFDTWKCFCCDEWIQKKNVVLSKVYVYELKKTKFLFLNFYQIEEIKKSILYNKDSLLNNDFIIWKDTEKNWWNIYFYRTKTSSMNYEHRSILRNCDSISLNRAYDLVSLDLDIIKQAFFDEFNRFDERKINNSWSIETNSNNYNEVNESYYWLEKIEKSDFVYVRDNSDLSIQKNEITSVEKQFEIAESIKTRIENMKKL